MTSLEYKYVQAVVYRQLHEEALLMDRLVAEAREQDGDFDEQRFRLQRAAEWRALGWLLKWEPFMGVEYGNGGFEEWGNLGEYIEGLRAGGDLANAIKSAIDERLKEFADYRAAIKSTTAKHTDHRHASASATSIEH